MSVKVAVRVRPFNTREKEMGAKLCVKMQGQTTILIDPKSDAPRDFSFDYSFWSHDGFEELESGYLRPESAKYADQQYVYQCLGAQVLDNAWQGYNCCLFAYGQTGSGKSYSMVGYGINKGIIPISSEQLFKRVDATKSESLSYQVTVSMLQIYNERVQDLLIPVNKRPQGGLQIRENKVTGVFVNGLSHHPVCSYAEIQNLMELGNTHRSIGSTQMNATSSRAHTIFTIEFKQVQLFQDRKAEKISVINLVDLAGSQKAGQTGATGERLKEGCAINKSLVVLGTVIEKLAEKSQGKNPNTVIPYRESALTRILQTALGGNSKTVMVCALSPATVNFQQTLSTLRYADRAKKIKNHAVVNQSVQDRMIRELKSENDELKKLIEQAGGLDKIRELQQQLAANESVVRQQMMSWEQRREQVQDTFHFVQQVHGAHITNLNQDPQLSGRIKYSFDELPLVVGRKNADPPVKIALSSSSVRPHHCQFDQNEDGLITLQPLDTFSSQFLFVNGRRVSEKIFLENLDRIIIGTSTVFMFKQPGIESDLREADIDYEFAMQEKNDQQQEEIELALPVQQRPRETVHQTNPQYQSSQNQPQSNSQFTSQSESQYQSNSQPQIESHFQSDPSEQTKQNLLNQIPRQQAPPTKKRVLHSQLAKLFPLVNEANLIANDLKRHAEFKVKIMNILPGDVQKQDDLDAEHWLKQTKVQVCNSDYGLVWLWDIEKFEDRLCMLRQMLDQPSIPAPEEDPLWDPPEQTLIGKGYYSLKPLGLLFDNPFDILIISTSGGDAGYLRMNILPIDQSGEILQQGPQSPQELIGQHINFCVQMKQAWNLPNTHSNNVYCEYHFPGIGIRRTNIVPGYSDHPVFAYQEQFYGVHVDNFLCNYMQHKKLAVSVYGTGMAMKIETERSPALTRPSYESKPAHFPNAESSMEEAVKRKQQQDVRPTSSIRPPVKEGKKGKKDCVVF